MFLLYLTSRDFAIALIRALPVPHATRCASCLCALCVGCATPHTAPRARPAAYNAPADSCRIRLTLPRRCNDDDQRIIIGGRSIPLYGTARALVVEVPCGEHVVSYYIGARLLDRWTINVDSTARIRLPCSGTR